MDDLTKNSSQTLLRPLAAALCLLLAATAKADDAVPLSVKVISVAGSARYSNKTIEKGSWTALRVGDELRADSVLQTTLKDSSADVELVGPDGYSCGKVRMFTNCVVKLIRLDLKKTASGLATDIHLEVPLGQIRVSLKG